MLSLGNRVCDEHLINGRCIDTGNGVTAKHSVSEKSIHLGSTLPLQQLSSARDGVSCVDDVVDQDTDAVRDVTHKHHAGIAVLGESDRTSLLEVLYEFWTGGESRDYLNYLVNQGKIRLEAIGDQGCSLRASGIGGDNDRVLVARDLRLDVVLDQSLSIEVVDGNIKEALVLGIVKIHGDNVVGAGTSQQVGNQSAGLGNPVLVTRLGPESRDVRLVFVVVGGVTPQGGDGVLLLVTTVRSGARDGIRSTGGCEIAIGAIDPVDAIGSTLVGDGSLGQLFSEVVNPIGQADRPGSARTGCRRDALEGVVISGSSSGLRQRSAGLVVGPVGLSGVGEERDNGSDSLC